jgi:hypothetical protein
MHVGSVKVVVEVVVDLYQQWFNREIQGSEFLVSLRAIMAETNKNMTEYNRRFGTTVVPIDRVDTGHHYLGRP